MKTIKTTLLLIVKDNKILLAEKKRGFGNGLFNGVGGKNIDGETIEQTMIRECEEEIFVTPKSYKAVGNIVFNEFMKGERALVDMTIFVANDYEGEPQESDEMKPYWFDLGEIPFEKMFPDDKYWLPKVLKGDYVFGSFVYDENFNILKNSFETKI